MVCIRIAAAMLACAAGIVAAAPASSDSASDTELLNELMSVVDESTTVATQTHLNVDFVPGMVTVLESATLQSLGARTVLDALSLIPGMLTYRGSTGAPFLLVRGISFPFNSGNVKVMVNSVAMSRESSGVSSSVLHMPIEQVERIEVVRGPGSVLYGEFAFMGVVNIITRTDGGGAFARVEEDGNPTAGGRWFYRSADRNTEVGFNVAGVYQNHAEVPDPASGRDDREFLLFSARHRGTSLKLQAVRNSYEPGGGPEQYDRASVAELRQAFSLGSTFDADVFVDAQHLNYQSNITVFAGDQFDGGLDAQWHATPRHTLLAKLAYTDEEIDETSFAPPPAPGTPPPPAFIRKGDARRYYGIAVQDQYALLDNLTLTAGARYDRREDLNTDRWTPRAAVVWQISDAHILKAQYAEGFRAPTYFELYPPTGKADLDLETIGTAELSYINRGPNRVARATLFQSHLDDMIFIGLTPGGPPAFGNRASGKATGAELEYEQQLTPELKTLANVSWVHSWTTRNQDGHRQDDISAANWLGNLALMYRPYSGLILGAHLNYVGARRLDDPSVPAEYRIALSATLLDVGTKGLSVRLALRNAAAADERTVVDLPTGVDLGEFDRRIANLTVSYEFR